MIKNEIYKSYRELCRMIREHRKAADLTQIELAHLAGVGKTAVFDVEHAKVTVQMDTILKILHVLNLKWTFSSPYQDRKNKQP